MHPISVRTASLASGEISWLEAGEGPELVLLHGGGLDSASLSWGHLVPDLAMHFHVRAPDWPGYGGSEWDGGEYTTERLVDCLEELLEHWKISNICLAGISLGGAVALGLALKRNDLVGRLVLGGSYGLQSHSPFHLLSYLTVWMPGIMPTIWSGMRWSRSSVRLTLQSVMWNTHAITDALVEQCYDEINQPLAGHAFMAWQRSEMQCQGLSTSYLEELGQVTQPTLLIHGDYDLLIPLYTAEGAAQRIPAAKLSVLESTGHWLQRDAPREFLSELTAFANQVN